MARSRSPNRDKAFEIYKENRGNIDLVKIAAMLEMSPGTVRGWKNKDAWEDKLNGTFRKDKERSKRKRGGQPGNKNGKGGPVGNKYSETHGFFSKYLPEDTFSIIQEIQQKDPLDILWENIQIQYAAIIRSQHIMHVKSKEDLTKELKKEVNGDSSYTVEYELQFAWDKQATFLQAQSRAMKTLESLIKQYEELLNRGLATEEQKARIEILKAQKSKIIGDDDSQVEDDGFIEALEGKVDGIWED